MRKIKREIVSALLFSKDNKLLMGKKDPTKGGVYPDCWHLPGGGVDDGESLVDALKREVIEEVGIDISNYNVILIDNTDKGESEKVLKGNNEKVICEMTFNVYEIKINDKTADNIKVELNDDLVESKWFTKEEIQNVKLTPPSVTLFSKLGFLK